MDLFDILLLIYLDLSNYCRRKKEMFSCLLIVYQIFSWTQTTLAENFETATYLVVFQ